jgi:MFS superfamily sulfate permease-like transporter
MRWMKALGIAAAVLIVFIVLGTVLHFLYWIAVGVVLAAAIFAAFKVHERYKLARVRHEQARSRKQEERLQREQERQQRSRHGEPRSVEAAPQQAPQIPPAAPAHHDIEEELARLKRDMR